MTKDVYKRQSLRRRKFFPYVGAYVAAVPTYVGGYMTLGFAAKQLGLDRVDAAIIQARAEASGVLAITEYWTPHIHVGAFHLPPYIARHLPAA